VLDLTNIPTIPGIFEHDPSSSLYPNRSALTFIRHIASQISQPIDRDYRIHVEYVPTQVVTEFIRAKVSWKGSKIDGIRYASSVNRGHVSYVLFADQLNLVGTAEPDLDRDRWLALVGTRRRWFDPSKR